MMVLPNILQTQSNQPQKILVLAAIPHGLRLDQEIREIEEAIRRATNRDLFEIKVRTAVRSQDIRRAIAEEQPQIVHFCGHGEKDGSLQLEDEGGNNTLVASEGLASLFKLHANYVKCVLLNACYSEKLAVAISQHINFVVGMNNPIQDRAAIEFAKGFYDGLGYKNLGNQDVFIRAFDEGMVAIQLSNLLQGSIPVLKKKLLDQKEQIKPYEENTLSNTDKIVPPLPDNSDIAIRKNQINSNPNTNPFIPLSGKIDDEKLFFPRLRELNRIFEHLNSGANVALIGEEGVGKSSLLWAIGHQSANQLYEHRQAVFLDLNEINDNEDEFYEALCHEIGIPNCRRNELNRNLKDKRILLAIDNVGKLAWKGFTRQVRDWLRSKADGMNTPLRLVLAASSPLEDLFQDSQNTSPLAGICQTENIGSWSEETIRSFIASRLQNTNVKNFQESDIIAIIKSSSGHPRQLMKLCNQIYEQYIQRT